MTAQPSLFDIEAGVDATQPQARHGQPRTSWDAAVFITANAKALRWKVLHLFARETWRADLTGWTNLEIEERLGLKRPTGSSRRLELEQHGLVERVPNSTRCLGNSQPAQVYRITPLGTAVYQFHVGRRQA